MTRTIEYYISLPYRIEITKIPDDEGGGFNASMPELGGHVFRAHGENQIEALENLQEVQQYWLGEYLERGVEIPEPIYHDLERFSGKFVARVPKYLHMNLVMQANENGVSLNQWLLHLLSSASTLNALEKQISDCTCRFYRDLWEAAEKGLFYDRSIARKKMDLMTANDYEYGLAA